MGSTWHWQERFDAVGPEEACRVQVLKIQKQISYDKWLKQKKHKAKQSEFATAEDGADEAKKAECEQRFMEWVRLKQRQKKLRQKEQARGDTPKRKDDQPYVKPPSLHVNPVRGSKKKSIPPQKQPTRSQRKLSPEQASAVFGAWERRKKREDKVKRKHEQLDRQLQEHAQRLLHLTRWKKKDVVCAYSTNCRATKGSFERTQSRVA